MAEHERSATGPDTSTAELVERLSSQVSLLVRDELALATAEMKRKGATAGFGIGISGAAVLLALFGLAVWIAAAVLGLSTVLAAWLSALIVGAVLLLIAGVLAVAGIGQVRSATPPTPEKAVESTKRDVEAVRESVRQ